MVARAHNRTTDASQPAVAGALEDEQQGVSTLNPEERDGWNTSVATYQAGLARQNSFFQARLAPLSSWSRSKDSTSPIRIPVSRSNTATVHARWCAHPVGA